MKYILNYWLDLGIDGVRIDALKHVYESENMKDEPIIDSNMAVNYNNLNHIYTTDQEEIYDLIKEWRLLLDDFKQNDSTRLLVRYNLRVFIKVPSFSTISGFTVTLRR